MPTAVLSELWRELRERRGVKIDHPDLPAELRDAAGALMATLWERSTAIVHAALKDMYAEARVERDATAAEVRRRAQAKSASGRTAGILGRQRLLAWQCRFSARAPEQGARPGPCRPRSSGGRAPSCGAACKYRLVVVNDTRPRLSRTVRGSRPASA